MILEKMDASVTIEFTRDFYEFHFEGMGIFY